jgi:ABC-type transporter Mla subunit MlaD
MTKQRSRPQRWVDAVAEANEAVAELEAAKEKLSSALQAIKEVQDEYQNWLSNMSENLQSSPTAEKLEAVCEIDLEVEDVEGMIEAAAEAEAAELPLGFGRD